jgi:microcystin-dependent protein
VLDPATGNALSGASVAVAVRSTAAAATIYAAETGGTTVANPRTTDAYGRLTGWVERGAYTLTISGSTLTTYVKNWDSAPAADSSIDALWIGSALPIGLVNPFAGSTAPTGWLLCDGSSVSTTTYASLFAVVAYTYGGSGASFTLPDLRGRAIAGKDNMGGTAASRLTSGGSGITGSTLGAAGGTETHTLTTAQLASHSHTGTTGTESATHTHGLTTGASGSPFTIAPQLAGTTASSTSTTGTQSANHTHSFTTATNGSGSAHQNAQPTIVLNYIIRAL